MAPKLTEDEIEDLIYFSRAGEDEDLTTTLSQLADREQVTPAEILVAARDERKVTALHMAAGNGHLEIVRKIIQHFDSRPKEEKQAFLDEANEHGNTGLHWAALGGHLDIVKLLMDQGALPALANEQDYVPLDLANFNDKREVAEYFLAASGMLEEKNQESGLNGAVESVKLEEGNKKESTDEKEASS